MATTSRRSGSKKKVQPNRVKPLASKEKCPPTVGRTEEIECKVILQKLSDKYKKKLEQLKENDPPSLPIVQLIEPDSPSPTKIAKLVEDEPSHEGEPHENTTMDNTENLLEENNHMDETLSEHNLRQGVSKRGTRRKLMDKQVVPVPSTDTQLVQEPVIDPTNRRKVPPPRTSPKERVTRNRRKVPSPCTSNDSEPVQNTSCSSTETSPSKDSTTSDNSLSQNSSENSGSIFDFDEPQDSLSHTPQDDPEGEEITSIASEMVDSQPQSPTSTSSRIKPEYMKALQSKTPVLKHKKKKGVRRKKSADKQNEEEEWLEKMKNEFAEVDKFDLIVQ